MRLSQVCTDCLAGSRYIIGKKARLFAIDYYLVDFNRLKKIALLFVYSNFKQCIQFRFRFRSKLTMQLRFQPSRNVSFGASFILAENKKKEFR